MSDRSSIGGRALPVLGAVRFRQIADRVRHQISFLPLVYLASAIVVVQGSLLLDRSLNDQGVPDFLATTVDGARSVFSALAGGLITSITLLLSMMLVAVQLASTQFSPRTMRDWLGNRTLQHAIGIVLGTTMFCLLALRSTRDFGDDSTPIVPHATVLAAVALGVVSLIAVVRAVDHLTHSVQVGSVARRVAADTIGVIARNDDSSGRAAEEPTTGSSVDADATVRPCHEVLIEAPHSGWVQQIDALAILAALPEHGIARVDVRVGGFVPSHAPLVRIEAPHELDRRCIDKVTGSFAVGDGRTLQQDVEFGLIQLTDIAVRALSPGVNDPTTACDVIVHIGDVLLEIWQREAPQDHHHQDGRCVVVSSPRHADHLVRSVGPIRRYGSTEPEVMTALVDMLGLVRSEVLRRRLSGPITPLDDAVEEAARCADTSSWSATEAVRFRRAVVGATTSEIPVTPRS